MKKQKSIFEQEYNGNYFTLNYRESGRADDNDLISYPNFYVYCSTGYFGCTIGQVSFREQDQKCKLYFYPNHKNMLGFTVELMGALNKYVNHLQKEWRTIKHETIIFEKEIHAIHKTK